MNVYEIHKVKYKCCFDVYMQVDLGRPDYQIADISLAGFGRKEIDIAEHEMPGLLSIRKK